MRTALIAALLAAAAAAPAGAQDSASAPPAEEPICTTTTTVVKKGDTVLSTNTTTRCDDGKGFGLPTLAPGSIFSSILGEAVLEEKEVRGEWRVVERGSRRVCQMTLMSEPTRLGRRVRTKDCRGPQGKAAAWKLEDQTVGLYGGDGGLIVRLTGDETRLAGTAGGAEVVLQR